MHPSLHLMALAVACSLASAAQAQSWPAKPIRIIVATAPGGGTDFVARAEPDLPTIAEAGVPGYEVTNWHGLIGPKGMPRAVVERLHGEMAKILKLKEMEDRLQADGVTPAGGSSEQLFEQVRKEIEQWRQVVTRAGIKIN